MNRPAAPASLPAGFGVELDAGTKRLSDGTLFGGSPLRAMRLTEAGQAALRELKAGPVELSGVRRARPQDDRRRPCAPRPARRQ